MSRQQDRQKDRKANCLTLTPVGDKHPRSCARTKTQAKQQNKRQKQSQQHTQAIKTKTTQSKQHKATHSKTLPGEMGKGWPTKGEKEIPTAPLMSTSHPPDPRRSQEGRASNKRGVGESPSTTRGQENQNKKREEKTDRKGPPAHCRSPRAKIDNGS